MNPETSESCPWCRTYVIPGAMHLCTPAGERFCQKCQTPYMDGLTHICDDAKIPKLMEKLKHRTIKPPEHHTIPADSYSWRWGDHWSDQHPPPVQPPGHWHEQYQKLMIEQGKADWVRAAMRAQFEEYAPKTFPTEKRTECVVGYRKWHLKRVYPDGWMLCSLNSGKFHVYGTCSRVEQEGWPGYQAKEAICNRAMYDDEAHKSPEAECACGIHAYKEPITLDAMTPMVYGTLNMWGKIIEHSEGYRAQYAYPSHLAVYGKESTERMRDDLQAAYGVPVELWS